MPWGGSALSLTLGLFTAACCNAQVRLATGLRLDPVGEAIDLGSMPLAMALAPGGERAAVVLSGWREQGLQIVDLNSRRVLQTLPQEAAFFGIAFSANGKEITGPEIVYKVAHERGGLKLCPRSLLCFLGPPVALLTSCRLPLRGWLSAKLFLSVAEIETLLTRRCQRR